MLRDSCFVCGATVYGWMIALVVGLWMFTGCMVSMSAPFPDEEPCVVYQDAMMVPGPSMPRKMTPAPFGVRIIVDASFDPFVGASQPVYGGRLAWSVWVYHWDDGDHLGAIGRLPDADFDTVPRGGMCRWYDPL